MLMSARAVLQGLTLGHYQHRFQIFKKVGVKFNELLRLQRNLNHFTVNLPLDFSEIFNIFRITVFSFFFTN